MATVELSDDELGVVRAALEVYLESLSHEEQDRVNAIERVLKRLGGDPTKAPER